MVGYEAEGRPGSKVAGAVKTIVAKQSKGVYHAIDKVSSDLLH